MRNDVIKLLSDVTHFGVRLNPTLNSKPSTMADTFVRQFIVFQSKYGGKDKIGKVLSNFLKFYLKLA